MKVVVVYNKEEIKDSDVINRFGLPTMERYKPHTIEMVASALESGGHNVRIIEGNMHVISELQNFMPRVVKGERQGMIFNMAYGIQGQSRYTHIPAMLEMLGIPYVGSGPGAHAIALDKIMSKIIFLQHHLPTPDFWIVSDPDQELSNIQYPAIVKPKMEAVSIGLQVVRTEEELRNAVGSIFSLFKQQALIEKFIPGREFSVALLGNGVILETLPIVEIDFEGDPNGIQTLENKTKHPMKKVCPADINRYQEIRLSDLARNAFNALELNDFARVDFRMDYKGNIYILEINSMASLNPTGSFVLAAQTLGLNFRELVNRILDIATIRYFGQTSVKPIKKEDKLSVQKPFPLPFRVRKYLRSRLPTTMEYLKKMVSIQSNVYDLEGINELGNWISHHFMQMGFYRQVFPQTEVGNIFYFKNHKEEHNDVLLIAHLDTIYNHQTFIPYREEHGRIYGSGVAVSKGGIAIIIAALQALRFARVLKNIRCGILLTPDDSLNGRISKEYINHYVKNSRKAIGTKNGDINGGIVVSCSGTQQYQIDFNINSQAKLKSLPDLVSAVAQKLLEWKKPPDHLKRSEVIINSINSQQSFFGKSFHVMVKLTVRFINEKDLDELDLHIRQIAEKEIERTIQTRIRIIGTRSPITSSRANRNFFNIAKQLADQLEIKVEPIYRNISSDICHIPQNIPLLGGMGPLGSLSESSTEYILRDSLIDRSALLALIINDCGEKKNTLAK